MIKKLLGKLTRPATLVKIRGHYYIPCTYNVFIESYSFVYQEYCQNIFGVWMAKKSWYGCTGKPTFEEMP